jgi:type I pantothenate kinase
MTRAAWAARATRSTGRDGAGRAAGPQAPDEAEIDEVLGPLAELLALAAARERRRRLEAARRLDVEPRPAPFVVGVVGAVSVGKSTLSGTLRGLLEAGWPVAGTGGPGEGGVSTAVVSTDAFLFDNAELARRGLSDRKGFPESYDWDGLARFLTAVREGEPRVSVPVYSHVRYDIEPGRRQVVAGPGIVIVEGLNLLQVPPGGSAFPPPSDLVDLSVYLHAEEPDIRHWFVERFLGLRGTVFSDPDSYFTTFAGLSDAEAVATAGRIWDTINGPNLAEHIAPTRPRADVVLVKGPDHRIEEVHLREPWPR